MMMGNFRWNIVPNITQGDIVQNITKNMSFVKEIWHIPAADITSSGR